MEERRKLQRFNLEAQTKIHAELAQGKKTVLNLVTKDISSGGTYVITRQPLSKGIPVSLEMVLTPIGLTQYMGSAGAVKVSVNGRVIRREKHGMAIMFDGKYTMSPSDTGRG